MKSTLKFCALSALLLFAGNLYADSWSQWSPSNPPVLRWSQHTIYDPIGQQMVFFGGYSDALGGTLNQTWSLSTSGSPAWNQLAQSGNIPPARQATSAIYDPIDQQMVIFSGGGQSDVWALSLAGTPAWSQLSPSGTAPSQRNEHSAIYDPINQRMIVFGGNNGSDLNDTWALSLSGSPAWTNLSPSGTPPPARNGHIAVYDAANQRMIVFGGGAGNPNPMNDVWALSLTGTPTWTQLAPTGTAPGPRWKSRGIYDAANHRLLIYGGLNTIDQSIYSDLWALSLDGTPAWMQLSLPNPPPAVWNHDAVYDSVDGAMIIYGGTLAQPWVLNIASPTPTPTSSSSPTVTPTFSPSPTPSETSLPTGCTWTLHASAALDPVIGATGDMAYVCQSSPSVDPAKVTYFQLAPGTYRLRPTGCWNWGSGPNWYANRLSWGFAAGTLASPGALGANQEIGNEPTVTSSCLDLYAQPGYCSGPDASIVVSGADQLIYVFVRDQLPGDNSNFGFGAAIDVLTCSTPTPTVTPTNVACAGNFLLQWGSAGTGPSQFNSPGTNGMALDPSGNVFVADTGNNRIQKFDHDGNFLLQWGSAGSGNGQFSSPNGLAVDGTGYVYVVDNGNNRVQKFDFSGAYLGQWSVGNGAGMCAVDASGNVYVSSDSPDQIQKFSSTGSPITQWGSHGSGNGQFWAPEGLAVDQLGYVYVADKYNYRVQKFSGSGAYVTQWGSQGSGSGQFNGGNMSVAVDAAGNVYVTDSSTDVIQEFSGSGAFTTSWGGAGAGPGQFMGMTVVAIDPSGTVYIADSASLRVEKFGCGGAVQSITPSRTITVTPSPTPAVVYNYARQWATMGAGNNQLSNPSGIAVSGGEVFVADTNNNRVMVFDLNGNYLSQFTSDFNLPTQIEVSGGYVYIADRDNQQVKKFDLSGNLQTTWTAEHAFPVSIAVDASHCYLGYTMGGHFTVSDLVGNFGFNIGSLGAGNGQVQGQTGGIGVDGSALYVSDLGNNRLEVFDKSGNYVSQWGAAGSGDGQFNQPTGISLDSASVYVADLGNDRVQVFGKDGSFKGKAGFAGTGDGQLSGPRDVDVDAAGYIYVADAGNNRIEVFGPAGVPALSETPSSSATPSASPSGTPSVTSSATMTDSPTGTATVTPTATQTATPCVTPTDSPSPTASVTLTATPTASPTLTVTVTLTVTPTATSTMTPLATASPTVTGSPVPGSTSSIPDPGDTPYVYPSPFKCGGKVAVKLEKPGSIKIHMLDARGHEKEEHEYHCNGGVNSCDFPCGGMGNGLKFMLVEINYDDGDKARLKPVHIAVTE